MEPKEHRAGAEPTEVEARGEARGFASPCRAGDREARGGARELYGVTREGRDQELSMQIQGSELSQQRGSK